MRTPKSGPMFAQQEATYKRTAWLYGYDYANAVWDMTDPATNADIAAWRNLGASTSSRRAVVRR